MVSVCKCECAIKRRTCASISVCVSLCESECVGVGVYQYECKQHENVLVWFVRVGRTNGESPQE
jgi:hypothetical protein